MKRLIPILLTLILCLSPLFLSGCWDRVEVNDIAIVVASAVDKEDDGRIRMTLQIPLVSQMGGMSGGGGGGGKKNFTIDTEVGRTVREANAKQQLKLPRRLYFSHRRVMLISEDVAKELGIRDMFDVVSRVPENRLNANLVIVKGKAYKMLTEQPRLEKFTGESIREIVESESVLGATMKDVAQMLNQYGVDPMIPYMGFDEQGKKPPQMDMGLKMLGYAVFRDDKMIDTVKGDSSEGIFWLKQDFHPYGKTIDFDGGSVSLNLYKGKAKVQPVLLKDHIRFDVKLQATAYVMESTAPIDFIQPEQVRKVEGKLTEEIRKSLDASVAMIKEHQADVAQLGLVVSRNYPRKWQMEYLPRWRDELKNLEFTYDVRVKISRIGLSSENITKKERK